MNKLFALILLVIFVSCEKEDSPHFTETVLGEYECVVKGRRLNIAPLDGMNPVMEDYSDTLVIDVKRSETSGERITIDGIEATMEEDGTLNSYHAEPINCGRGEGYINGDSLYFYKPDIFCEGSETYYGIKLAE